MQLVREANVGGFRIAELAFAPHEELPMHEHELASVGYIAAGSLVESYRRTTLECAADSVKFRPHNLRHSDRFGATGARCVMLAVEPALIARADLAHEPISIARGDASWIGARLRRELHRADPSSLALEGLALELVGAMSRGTDVRGVSPRLAAARALLDRRFRERVTVNCVAAEVGLHPVYLASEFRRRFGTTIAAYVRGRRLDAAQHELAAGRSPLAEIALACGFANQSHFSRAFRDATGMSPSEFRTLRRGK